MLRSPITAPGCPRRSSAGIEPFSAKGLSTGAGQGGTGLGLFLFTFLSRHGVEPVIEVWWVKEHFVLSFSVGKGVALADQESRAILQAKQPALLVVDDEELALMVIPEALRDGLEDLGWHHLTIGTAASGRRGSRREWQVDLLVTDVVMPGIDVIESFAASGAATQSRLCGDDGSSARTFYSRAYYASVPPIVRKPYDLTI